ncbi:HET domain-containing protein [Colletotrichum simmondsii]|uniref:HET domain-containing protein n=1 Tax=Colletotrichum simmondsii TaxID=703756 RepID=A0A135T1Z3_9PEZI|nr:HET domain-containing protein [Colletotrichum simmondsii]
MPSPSPGPHSCEWCRRLLVIHAESDIPHRNRVDRHDARWNKIVFDASLTDLLQVQQKTCAFIDWILDVECIARPDIGECVDNISGEVYEMDLEELEQFHGQIDKDPDYRLPSMRHAVQSRNDGYVDYVLVAETNPPFRMGGDHTPDVLTIEYFGLWDSRTKLVSYRTVKGLQIYTSHNDPAARDFWTRPIQNDPANCLPTVKSWLADCEAKHEKCRELKTQSGPSALRPARLIYIGPNSTAAGFSLRLQDTANLNPLPRFAALSYCWGGNQTVKCETSTLEAFTKNIPFHKLPQTIQDAVKVCAQLGVEYIWVDALCIIQNEGNDEKILEIAKMPYIYGQASFTIMASRAKTAWEGFLHHRGPFTKSNQAFLLSWQPEKGKMGSITLAEMETGHEPIDERGWTFQERLLSLRIVEFGSRQTRWSCQEPIPSITGDDTLYGLDVGEGATDGWRKIAEPNDLRQDSFNWGHCSKTPSPWGALVDIYTSRTLSFNTDRALAMSGVAERFAVLTGDEYAAGLWKRSIRDELLWRVEQSERRNRSTVYQGPSWSWFAVNSSVRAYVALGDGWEIPTFEGDVTDATEVYHAEVVSISAEPVNKKAPYGDVSGDSGRLRFRGRLAAATLINHPKRDSMDDPENVFDISSPQSSQGILDSEAKLMSTRNTSCHLDCLDEVDAKSAGSEGYMALEIKRVRGYSADWTILGLLLQPIKMIKMNGGSSLNGLPTYRRIGTFELELETTFDDLNDDESLESEERCFFDFIQPNIIEIL